MVKTIREFEEVVRKLKKELDSMNNKGFLNEAGIRTMEAYNKLLRIVPFFDDLKEFAEYDKVKDVINEYADCDEIKHVKWFLDKQRGNN